MTDLASAVPAYVLLAALAVIVVLLVVVAVVARAVVAKARPEDLPHIFPGLGKVLAALVPGARSSSCWSPTPCPRARSRRRMPPGLRWPRRCAPSSRCPDAVACRPGHPQLLAQLPDGCWILGLPGNPYAALLPHTPCWPRPVPRSTA
ncbi:hypothetical protein [Streptomyces sp. NRRL S-1813]|uniref:hypothetical protein n=1 Tax=Streptomyces sp. NRRL S-1813 TaxID=1463888 RepID=UPI00131CC4F2|nr:hypothetical protein [Streptomyces sp. NRRL S-1813]